MQLLLQKSLFVLLAVVGLHVVILNYTIAIRWLFQRKHHSFVPFIGGISLCLSILVLPGTRLTPYAWVPLVADLGCTYLVGAFLYSALVLKAFKR